MPAIGREAEPADGEADVLGQVGSEASLEALSVARCLVHITSDRATRDCVVLRHVMLRRVCVSI